MFHILLARSDLNSPVWEPGLQDSPSACPILNWQWVPCGKSDTDSVSSALARFCLVSHLLQPRLTYTACQGAGEVSTACCLLPGGEGLFPLPPPPSPSLPLPPPGCGLVGGSQGCSRVLQWGQEGLWLCRSQHWATLVESLRKHWFALAPTEVFFCEIRVGF